MKSDIIWEKDKESFSVILIPESDDEQIIIDLIAKNYDNMKIKKDITSMGESSIHTLELHPIDKVPPSLPVGLTAEINHYVSGKTSIKIQPKTSETWALLELWHQTYPKYEIYKASSISMKGGKTEDFFCIQPIDIKNNT